MTLVNVQMIPEICDAALYSHCNFIYIIMLSMYIGFIILLCLCVHKCVLMCMNVAMQLLTW